MNFLARANEGYLRSRRLSCEIRSLSNGHLELISKIQSAQVNFGYPVYRDISLQPRIMPRLFLLA